MAIKIYKPVTPGLRGMTGYSFEEITRTVPERSLLVVRKKTLRSQQSGTGDGSPPGWR